MLNMTMANLSLKMRRRIKMNLCWIYRKEDNPDLWNGDSPDEYFQFICDVIEYWKQAWDPDIDEEDKEFLDNSVLQPIGY